jgi:hypothetical protein
MNLFSILAFPGIPKYSTIFTQPVRVFAMPPPIQVGLEEKTNGVAMR